MDKNSKIPIASWSLSSQTLAFQVTNRSRISITIGNLYRKSQFVSKCRGSLLSIHQKIDTFAP